VRFILLLLLGGGLVLLPELAGHLPGPLATVARLPERILARFVPPRVPPEVRLADLTPAERAAVKGLGARLAGLLVWSSNRGGNHDLYLLDLRSQTVRRLTTHPHVDFLSRFSPDGRRVVFLRSQREWVSFREESAWDVLVINADGTGEERIARGAYHPTWVPDGSGVVYYRGPRIFRYDFATRRETLLVDAAAELGGRVELGDPEMGPSRRHLAFYLRGHAAGAAVFDLETRALVPLTREQACQTTWAPDGRALVWVETGGQGGTRVMTGGSDGAGRRVLIDLPGRHSHEYFPKLASDGRWLVWGATAEGHEHDRADYEIFLWELGAPPESAVRLTHHPGNDQWPDLWIRPRGGA
jgi:Tol biopolymer transport system component